MKPRSVIFFLIILLLGGVLLWNLRRGDAGQVANGGRPETGAAEEKTAIAEPGEKRNERNSGRERAGGADENEATNDRPHVPPAREVPVVKMAAHGAAPTFARVVANGKSYDLVPNQLGEFQRVYLEKGGLAEVSLQFPEAKPGDTVVAAIQDGGTVNRENTAAPLQLDDNLSARFSVETTAEGGISRVLVTHGADRKTLIFWGGAEHPLKSEVAE